MCCPNYNNAASCGQRGLDSYIEVAPWRHVMVPPNEEAMMLKRVEQWPDLILVFLRVTKENVSGVVHWSGTLRCVLSVIESHF